MDTIDNTTHNHRILVVEDDVLLGEVIKEAIGQFYPVTLLDSAREVLPTLGEQSFDLVMLDLMLPTVNGFELLQAIRGEHSPDDLSIIIMSAIGDANSIVQGFAYGANDYMVKPAELSVMIARINTQLKLLQYQRERKQYIQTLENNDEFRKQLNQIASHDLKHPINNLRLAEGLLREEAGEIPRISPLLNTITVSLDMMQHIVEAFIDMVAIQTNSVSLKSVPILIKDLINNAYTQYELVADKKNIRMLVGDTEGIILADPGRMAQIAGNLVSNAIKYSPRESSIKMWSTINDRIVRLNVEDSGSGVPQEERHLLFTEFGKLSTRPTDGEGSTGLGLWIVKHLVELQGGRAGADFPSNGGSIFWIEMPLADMD